MNENGNEENIIQSPEVAEQSPSAERIAEIQTALGRLYSEASDHSQPFERDIRRVEHVFNPDGVDPENGRLGEFIERNIDVDTGDPSLRTIQLRTFVGEDDSSAYRMSLIYKPNEDGSMPAEFMLSGEWPLDTGTPLTDNLIQAQAQGRRFQDFMFTAGAENVPVRQADFTFVAWYRPVGGEKRFDVTSEYMDQVLKIVADATVMDGKKKGPTVRELVPSFDELVQVS